MTEPTEKRSNLPIRKTKTNLGHISQTKIVFPQGCKLRPLGVAFRITRFELISGAKYSKKTRNWKAVFQCECGELQVCNLRHLSKNGQRRFTPIATACESCNGEESQPAWVYRLRERIVRHQGWFNDRTGKARCSLCGKHRVWKMNPKSDVIEFKPSTTRCRQCEAESANNPHVEEELREYSIAFEGHPLWKTDANPSFEDAVRLLEGP